MADDDTPSRGNGNASDRLAFDYIKSQFFRVIRADGVIGSVTPKGFIHMVFFSERPAIPKRVVYQLSTEGRLGNEIEGEKVSRDSIVREMDADLFMNLKTARSFRDWLSERIRELEEMKEKKEQQAAKKES